MKEYIFNINNQNASTIVIPNAPTGLTMQNILAILNESTKKVLHSPFAQNVYGMTYGDTNLIITMRNAPSAVGSLMVKLYTDVDLATENTANATKTAVGIAPVGSERTTVFQYLAAILDNIEGQGGEDIPEGLGDRINLLLQFFGLPQALPEYHAMTTAEVLEIADEEWLAMYGFVAVPNTLHTVNPLGQQVTIATYFKPSRTYGDYGFTELWAQNDQQQWVSILNDNPTADRDIYTYNPSNNE